MRTASLKIILVLQQQYTRPDVISSCHRPCITLPGKYLIELRVTGYDCNNTRGPHYPLAFPISIKIIRGDPTHKFDN